MWRHQSEHQWESSKNFRTPRFRTGSKSIYFDHLSDFYMSICKVYMHSFLQNSMWRSGNWQKVKNFRTLPFKEYWLDLLFFGLLSLNVEFPRVYKLFWCLSVDESCDTVKNIFSSLTVLIRKRNIGSKCTKWYLKLKHLLHSVQIYYFCDQRIIELEVLI